VVTGILTEEVGKASDENEPEHAPQGFPQVDPAPGQDSCLRGLIFPLIREDCLLQRLLHPFRLHPFAILTQRGGLPEERCAKVFEPAEVRPARVLHGRSATDSSLSLKACI